MAHCVSSVWANGTAEIRRMADRQARTAIYHPMADPIRKSRERVQLTRLGHSSRADRRSLFTPHRKLKCLSRLDTHLPKKMSKQVAFVGTFSLGDMIYTPNALAT
jgi:hypothetical protein